MPFVCRMNPILQLTIFITIITSIALIERYFRRIKKNREIALNKAIRLEKENSDIQTNNEIQALREAYNYALNSGDKGAALKAGRAYYARVNHLDNFMSGDERLLTLFDEQKITNDIASMKITTK